MILLVDFNSSFNEFVEKPIVKAILKLLAKEELTISQIEDKLEINDTRMLVAYLTELQYLGLIIPAFKENNQGSRSQKQHKDVTGAELLINLHSAWDSPLGIPIAEYNTLWQKISKDNRNEDLSVLKNVAFTLPAPLKEKFKELTKEEEE